MKHRNFIIETPVFVELEGKEVLKFISKDDNYVRYSVIGFTDEQVRLIDYRTKGLETIDIVLNTTQVNEFPKNFCFPSQVKLSHIEDETLIELFDLRTTAKPELMLWITTGLEEPIPDYKYPFFRIEPVTETSYSFISLFNYRHYQSYFDGVFDRNSL